MPKNLAVLILVENSIYRRDLIAEHGLSFWFKYGDEEYLFDTGQGMALFENAKKLDIDFNRLKAVFLSHGHDDHTGGLRQLLSINPDIDVIAHPDVFEAKYSRNKEIGMDVIKKDINLFRAVKDNKEIYPGIFLTGEVPRTNDFETKSKKYTIKIDEKIQIDTFRDDETLFIETNKGLVLLLGCSHSGIVNIIEYIKKLKGNDKIYAIIGGMHLINAGEDRIKQTISYLKKINFELLIPLHCTGFNAVRQMKNEFGDRVNVAHTGDRFIF